MKKTVCLLVLCLILGACLVSCSDGVVLGMYPDAECYSVGNTELAAEQVNNLMIYWTAGKVTVEPWSGDTIAVQEACPEDTKGEHRVHWFLDGDTLRIRYAGAGVSRVTADKALVVRIPRTLALEDVRVDATSAEATIGSLVATSFTGKNVSGKLALAAGGRIGRITAESVSGDILLGTSGISETTVKTISGRVDLYLPTRDYTLTYTTAGGRFWADSGMALDAQGNVTVGSGRTLMRVATTSGNLYCWTNE